MPKFELKIFTSSNTQLPTYANAGDAGADLRSTEDFTLEPGQRRLVGTGVHIALPDDYVAFVHPRSGLAAKHGITIVNAPGTVDSGYRGEIKVCLLNTDSSQVFSARAGDRIAQIVFQKVERATFCPVDALEDLGETKRGANGHGSTGVI